MTTTFEDPRKYVQVSNHVRQAIASGTCKTGDRAPSTFELASMYNCNRLTAGKAMRILEQEGLVVRLPGLGYHIA